MDEDCVPCTVCGGPVLYGSRHVRCAQMVWRKFPEENPPAAPAKLLVTTTSKVVWMADFYQGKWRVGDNPFTLPADAITHWMIAPSPAGE